ncbi:MAG: hypothetical protein MZW92_02525 [Comamonadaceae bacterium]|nr:hypothetical protein [Comamonadaceae bacterium]
MSTTIDHDEITLRARREHLPGERLHGRPRPRGRNRVLSRNSGCPLAQTIEDTLRAVHARPHRLGRAERARSSSPAPSACSNAGSSWKSAAI